MAIVLSPSDELRTSGVPPVLSLKLTLSKPAVVPSALNFVKFFVPMKVSAGICVIFGVAGGFD